MSQVRDLIVGPPGSLVKLSVLRKMRDDENHNKDVAFDLELVRAEIQRKEGDESSATSSHTDAMANRKKSLKHGSTLSNLFGLKD